MRTKEELEAAIAKITMNIIGVQQNDRSDQRIRRLAHLEGMLTSLLWMNGEDNVLQMILNGREVKGEKPATQIQMAAASLADVCREKKWFSRVEIGLTRLTPQQQCIILRVNGDSTEPFKYMNRGWAGFPVQVERLEPTVAVATSDN